MKLTLKILFCTGLWFQQSVVYGTNHHEHKDPDDEYLQMIEQLGNEFGLEASDEIRAETICQNELAKIGPKKLRKLKQLTLRFAMLKKVLDGNPIVEPIEDGSTNYEQLSKLFKVYKEDLKLTSLTVFNQGHQYIFSEDEKFNKKFEAGDFGNNFAILRLSLDKDDGKFITFSKEDVITLKKVYPLLVKEISEGRMNRYANRLGALIEIFNQKIHALNLVPPFITDELLEKVKKAGEDVLAVDLATDEKFIPLEEMGIDQELRELREKDELNKKVAQKLLDRTKAVKMIEKVVLEE